MPPPDLVSGAGPALQEAFDQGLVEPEQAFGSPEERTIPEGRWFVHSHQGIPYQAGENSDPDNIWRLVFDEGQLAEAYPERKRFGYPILVDPRVLHDPGWLQTIERARVKQYETPDFRIDFLRLHGGEDGLLGGVPKLPPIQESFAPAPAPARPTRVAKHERSETVQLPDGSWVNVYGRSTKREGEVLEPKFPFEKWRYPSLQEAEAAAKRRSNQTLQSPDVGQEVKKSEPPVAQGA